MPFASVPPVEGPRADLFRCVETFPGIHLRRIERETSLPLGQVLYHLDRLERMGLVASSRDAGFRRYYSAGDVDRRDKPFLAALRVEVPRRVLVRLLERSPRAHRELQEALGVAPSTLSFHLNRLVASGVLSRERDGTTNRYSITDPASMRRVLLAYHESFRDDDVDRYVRSQLDALPPLAAPPPLVPS